MIKRANWAAAGAAGLFLWAFAVFFLDGLLRRALINASQAAAGAKVEIDSVRTRLFRGRIALAGVRVADRGEPMKNLLEFSEAVFQLRLRPALEGKVVVREAAVRGVRLGTPRKTSGALPRRGPSALERAVARELAGAKTSLAPSAAAARDIAVDPSQLASLKPIAEARARLTQVESRWKARLDASRIESELAKLREEARAIKEGGNSPAEVARKVEAVAKAKARLDALLKEVQAAKKGVQEEFAGLEAALQQAKSLKDQDLNSLLALAGLPSVDPASLSRRLLGPQLAGRLATALHWAQWARQRTQQSHARRPQPPARRRGVDIEFPRERSWPSFLLERAELSGAWSAGAKELGLSGVLAHVSSNPALLAKPTRLDLRAEDAQTHLRLEAELGQDVLSLSFQGQGLPLEGWTLGDSELGAALRRGRGSVRGQLRSRGEEWEARASLEAEGVALDPRLGLSGDVARFAANALAQVRRFQVELNLTGREDNLRVGLSSDLGSALAAGMRSAFSSELAQMRKELERKLDAVYGPQAAKLQEELGRLQVSLLGPLNKQQAAIQEMIEETAVKSFSNPLKGLKKLFR